MDWDQSDFEWRSRYRLCRAGFGLCAMGLLLLTLDCACHLGLMFWGRPELIQVVDHPAWRWGVGSTITWGTMLGPLLLWGRWAEPRWRRQASFLVILNAIDVVVWFLRHGRELGLWEQDPGHTWLQQNVLYASSWVQFVLFASLATDLSAHLGSKSAPASLARVRSLAISGAMIWALMFLQVTAWRRGWPLVPRQRQGMGFLLGVSMIRGLASFHAGALCLLASRECTLILRELDWNDGSFQPSAPRSESRRDDDPWA